MSGTTLQASYINMMKKIREKLPKTRIFAMRTYGGYEEAQTKAAVDALVSGGDKRVYYINTTGWLVSGDYGSDGLHPTDAGQIKVAGKLSAVLKPYVDSIVQTSEVLDRVESKLPVSGIRLSPTLRPSVQANGRNMTFQEFHALELEPPSKL